MFENPYQKIYFDWIFRGNKILFLDKKKEKKYLYLPQKVIQMSKSEKQRVGLCNFLFHKSEFCTICKQWLHNEYETLRNRSAVSTETYLSPRLTPALHLKLFLLWTKNRKTMNGTFLTQEMAQSFSTKQYFGIRYTCCSKSYSVFGCHFWQKVRSIIFCAKSAIK